MSLYIKLYQFLTKYWYNNKINKYQAYNYLLNVYFKFLIIRKKNWKISYQFIYFNYLRIKNISLYL